MIPNHRDQVNKYYYYCYHQHHHPYCQRPWPQKNPFVCSINLMQVHIQAFR